MSTRNLFDDANPWSRPASGAGDVDMTAMIDCTFLLLIFFMVCSTMQSQPDIDLPVAVHSLGVETQRSEIITIFSGTAQTPPRIVLGDGAGEDANLEDVRPFVSEAVAAGRSQIVVKAEGDVTHGFLDEVIRQVTAVEGAQLYVGVGDEPTE